MIKHDLGMLNVFVLRSEKHYLPSAQLLRERVDGGVLLSEHEIQLIQSVLDELKQMIPVFNRNPKYQKLAGGIMALYEDIVLKVTESEN